MCVCCSLELIKTIVTPANIHSASLHPEKDFIVAGGDDFKLYKYDYGTSEELGEYMTYAPCTMGVAALIIIIIIINEIYIAPNMVL